MKTLITIFLLCFFYSAAAQTGCTDPQALNFDPIAVENDGSCIYPVTTSNLEPVAELPEQLKECSGAAWLDTGLWVHNDSGNENQLYQIDTINGNILQTVTIANAENVDWEDLAESEDHLFIGDFGNNAGNRTDLKIYRINKNDLTNDTAIAEVIEFHYSDQVDFSENTNNHNFDCEAFFFYNDQLHLFTKNWLDNQTKHYSLPATPGIHTAELEETFNVDGLITGADISSEKEIVLLGYTEFGFNFIWLLFDFKDEMFFSGNKRNISVGTGLTNSQTEAITFSGTEKGYVCSEQFVINNQLVLPQRMLTFSISQWVNGTSSVAGISPMDAINVFPNPAQDFFTIENPKQLDLNWTLYNPAGRKVRNGKTSSANSRIDASGLSPGNYYLLLSDGKRQRNFSLVME